LTYFIEIFNDYLLLLGALHLLDPLKPVIANFYQFPPLIIWVCKLR